MKKIIRILSAYICLNMGGVAASSAFPLPDDTKQFANTVFPITEGQFVGAGLLKFGTGFCLDPDCRFVTTNYHVAALGTPKKIKGDRVVHRYLATGPDDEGATINEVSGFGPLKYNLGRDLGILELRYPLAHLRGAEFDLDELESGEPVEIYAYPKEGANPFRHLMEFHGSFRGGMESGLLLFDYALSLGKQIRPGASGGIVVDGKTQKIVGVLNGIAADGELIASAVPIRALADFVRAAQPFLAQQLFPSNRFISPISADLYPKLEPRMPSGSLQHRPEEPAEVKSLRVKAQDLADSMRNLISVQSVLWGSGDKASSVSAAYEVQIIDGQQKFREYPDGQKELSSVPFPHLNTFIAPEDEWSTLVEMVGTKPKLQIEAASGFVLDGRKMKVFRYRADSEDELCRLQPVSDFIFFSKIHDLGCHGEVWTDEQFNIRRISEQFEMSVISGWTGYQAVITYGWVRRADLGPRLVPLTIYIEAKRHDKAYWCQGQFTDYREFGTKIRIAPEIVASGSEEPNRTALSSSTVN